MKKTILITALIYFLCGTFANELYSQGNSTVRKTALESILSKFSNYRYGNISIWKFIDKDRIEINKAIKDYEGKDDLTPKVDVSSYDKRIVDFIKNCHLGGTDCSTCYDDLFNTYPDIKIAWEDFLNLCNSLVPNPITTKDIESVYLVTTRGYRSEDGTVNAQIIALLASKKDKTIGENLGSMTPETIYVPTEMKNIPLAYIDVATAKNLYELAQRRLAQGNLENKTIEAQGIGFRGQFGSRTWGNVESLFRDENDITPEDIQKVKSISEIQPTEYSLKKTNYSSART